MEGNENKEEAGKGIPWLIESLKGKQKKGNPPVKAGRQKSSEAIHERQYGERRKGQHSSVSKNKGNGKGQR